MHFISKYHLKLSKYCNYYLLIQKKLDNPSHSDACMSQHFACLPCFYRNKPKDKMNTKSIHHSTKTKDKFKVFLRISKCKYLRWLVLVCEGAGGGGEIFRGISGGTSGGISMAPWSCNEDTLRAPGFYSNVRTAFNRASAVG